MLRLTHAEQRLGPDDARKYPASRRPLLWVTKAHLRRFCRSTEHPQVAEAMRRLVGELALIEVCDPGRRTRVCSAQSRLGCRQRPFAFGTGPDPPRATRGHCRALTPT